MAGSGYNFRRDTGNNRLMINCAGTEVFRITASGVTVYGGTFTIDSGGLVVTAGSVTLPAASVDAAALATPAFDGTEMATVANINTVGGPLLIFRIATTGAAGGENVDVVMTHKIRVLDFWAVNAAAGGAADTVQLLSTGSAITDALNMNVGDKAVVRAATINDANHEIIATGTLRVTEANGANNQVVDCYVLAVRVA